MNIIVFSIIRLNSKKNQLVKELGKLNFDLTAKSAEKCFVPYVLCGLEIAAQQIKFQGR